MKLFLSLARFWRLFRKAKSRNSIAIAFLIILALVVLSACETPLIDKREETIVIECPSPVSNASPLREPFLSENTVTTSRIDSMERDAHSDKTSVDTVKNETLPVFRSWGGLRPFEIFGGDP